MLRFLPDGWLEALLRPFLLMDPKAGIYFEEAAPDFRFALFVVFLAIAALTRHGPGSMTVGARQLILALTAVFYVWTLVIGNGRYFMTGLLVIGPMLVLAWRGLPGTPGFRWLLLAGAAALQCGVIGQTYMPNQWGLVRWASGAGVALSESPVRRQPAVFITATAISYSILVPKFHPRSRWANVIGQRDIMPGMREYEPLVKMLSSPLPKYIVMPIAGSHVGEAEQPEAIVRQIYGQLIRPYGLTMPASPCEVLRSNVAPGPPDTTETPATLRGFWVCPLVYSDAARRAAAAVQGLPARVAAAFGMIEQRCPRFFPPGNSNDRIADEIMARHYATDARLMADVSGRVYLKYFRALNPTFIGSVDEVLRGDFQVPCDKLPGRYQLPWQAD